LFSDELLYCTDDGSGLVLAVPRNDGEDYDTVIRPTNFVVDVGHSESDVSEGSGLTGTSEQITSSNNEGTKTTLLTLIAGIGFGGMLVLAIILLILWNSDKPVAVQPSNANSNSNGNVNSNFLSPSPSLAKIDSNKSSSDEGEPLTTQPVAPVDDSISDSSKSLEKQKSKRNQFNGRVIALNAIVRIAPTMEAPELGIISYNTPIKIGKSAGGNNPWFRITTRGGESGWIHGNMIEFVK